MSWSFYNASGKLIDGVIDGSITNAKLADDAVGADELAANAVVDASIASGAAIDAAKIANGTVSSAEFQRLNGVTSDIQTQLDAAGGANVKVGSFTRDTSASVGTQVVSGIGFTPKSVIFFTVQDGTHEMSVGMDDGTEARVVYHDHPTSANTFALADTSGSGMKSIRTIHASGGNTFNGKITALASGQFTVTWDKVGSPTGTITVMYMAFG